MRNVGSKYLVHEGAVRISQLCGMCLLKNRVLPIPQYLML